MTGTALGVPLSNIPDVINHSLPHFINKGGFEPIFELQNYYICDEMFQKHKMQFQSGNSIEWRVTFDGNGSAQFVLPFQSTPASHVDLLHKASAKWCYAEAKSVYEARIMSQIRGEAAIVDYLKTQMYGGLRSMFDLIEQSGFGIQQDANDELTPNGLPYWISPLPTGSPDYVGGFNGRTTPYGDGNSPANVGGIDPAVHELWRNWTGTHKGINQWTLQNMLRKALAQTGFRAPAGLAEYNARKKAPQRRIFTGINMRIDYANLVNAGPDNRNGDLNPFRQSGTLTFDGIEWLGLAILDQQARNPLYVVDLSCMAPFVHSGWWMRYSPAENDVDRRHVYVVQWDCAYNFACLNRRKQIVLTTDS